MGPNRPDARHHPNRGTPALLHRASLTRPHVPGRPVDENRCAAPATATPSKWPLPLKRPTGP